MSPTEIHRSQSDTENADLALEKKSLEENVEFEKTELARIYEGRGVEPLLSHTLEKSLQ